MQSKYKFLTQVKKYKLVAAVFVFNLYSYNERCDKFLHKDFNKTPLTGKQLMEFSLGISVYVFMCQCACIHPSYSI